VESPADRDSALVADGRAFSAALSALVRAYQYRDRERSCYGNLSVTECYALETIAEEGPLSVDGLAKRLFMDKSTASRVALSLGRKGYLSRDRRPTDRRTVELAATALGRTTHDRVRAGLEAKWTRLLAGYSGPVRRAVTALLGRIRPRGIPEDG